MVFGVFLAVFEPAITVLVGDFDSFFCYLPS
jgi:hypothetical protein